MDAVSVSYVPADNRLSVFQSDATRSLDAAFWGRVRESLHPEVVSGGGPVGRSERSQHTTSTGMHGGGIRNQNLKTPVCGVEVVLSPSQRGRKCRLVVVGVRKWSGSDDRCNIGCHHPLVP